MTHDFKCYKVLHVDSESWEITEVCSAKVMLQCLRREVKIKSDYHKPLRVHSCDELGDGGQE